MKSTQCLIEFVTHHFVLVTVVVIGVAVADTVFVVLALLLPKFNLCQMKLLL